MKKNYKKIMVVFTAFIFIQQIFAANITSSNSAKYREQFIEEVKSHIGCPYVYGATGPNKFDCSGLINYSALQATGIQLPRSSKQIYNYVKIIPLSEIEKGDLLFFATTYSGGVSHIGVYIGNNQFISALSEGKNRGVSISSLDQEYWKTRVIAAGQFLPNSKSNQFNKDKDTDSTRPSSDSFMNHFTLDTTLMAKWNLNNLLNKNFNVSAGDIEFNLRYSDWNILQPGLTLGTTISPNMNMIQIYAGASININKNFKIYVTPILCAGDLSYIGNPDKFAKIIYPGLIGVTASTNPVTFGNISFQLVQDINYMMCTAQDIQVSQQYFDSNCGISLRTGLRISF